MSKNIRVDERGREQVPYWYAIGITRFKEKMIRTKIKELMKQKRWQDQIFNIVLPTLIEKDAKGKDKEVFVYDKVGYIHMILNDETWNVLEMLRKSGFRVIMPAGEPSPVLHHEMEQLFDSLNIDRKELYLTPEQKLLIGMVDEDIEKDEVVLFKDENGNNQMGTIKEVLTDTYKIEVFEEDQSVIKEVEKEKATKIND